MIKARPRLIKRRATITKLGGVMTKPPDVITIITAGLINFAPVITKTAVVLIKVIGVLTKPGEVIAKTAGTFAINAEAVDSLSGIVAKLTDTLAKLS